MTHHQSSRPPLDRARLDTVVGDDTPWHSVDILDEATSTNALLAERAAAGAPSGLILVAEHQTAGRGRLDRIWETPDRAALTFSVLLRPDVPARRWSWISLLAGVGIVEALRSVTGLHVTLKWPNDILVGDRKVGGILSERVDTADGPAAIVGVGINVSTRREELPIPEASSLDLERSATHDRSQILAAVLEALGHDYVAWVNAKGEPSTGLRRRYLDFSSTVGSQVRVTLPGEQVVDGIAIGIDDDGGLEVDTAGGTRIVSVGDVVHVRAVT